MPVIRGEALVSRLTNAERSEIADRLRRELSGESTFNGPLIFEIPLDRSGKLDVVVVWDAWELLDSEDRSDMILDAYAEMKPRISLALGVTYQEALEQQVIPYSVVPMIRSGEIDPGELNRAMLAEGGFSLLAPGKVELRFPTRALAEAAHKRLSDRVPAGCWSIVQSAASL